MTSLRRCLQRLSIIALSLMAILAITVPGAQAADGSATIKITKPSDITTSLNGMTVKAYMVLDQVNDTETKAEKKQYAATSDFAQFFNISAVKDAFDGTNSVYLGYNDTGNHLTSSSSQSEGMIAISSNAALDATYPEADLISRITKSEDVATFYTWIEKYIEQKTPAPTPTTKTEISDDGSTITLRDLNEGYYALTFENVPDGVSVKQGILVATSETIDLKAEPITVTKQVNKDDGETYYDAVSAAMNQVLKYQITSKVPTVKDYSNLTKFTLTDTYTHQKLVQTSDKDFQLKVGGKTYTLSDGTKFVNGSETIATLDTTTSGTFTVEFNTNALANHQGADIVLTYYARLTADAVNVNPNEVTLNYTNNGSSSTEKDSTKVYTYGVDVQKTFSSSETHYDEVKFTLYTDTSGVQGNEIGLIGDKGSYHVPAVDDTTPTSTSLSLTDKGKLTITGLDAGTYWLVETYTPNGYTAAKPIKITLQASSTEPEKLDAEASSAYYNGDIHTTDLLTTVTTQDTTFISLGHLEVLNQKGFDLPQTGAAGVWLCVVGGLVLIAVAGVLFVASRGRRNVGSASRA